MNIVILKESDHSDYGVVDYFVKEIENELKNKNNIVKVFDLLEIDKCFHEESERSFHFLELSKKIENYIIENNVSFVLSLNGANCLTADFYQGNNIILGIILTEHPFKHIKEINKYKGYTTFVSMIDEGMLDTFENYIDNSTLITWLMLGGSINQEPRRIEKEYDILICETIEEDFELEDNVYEGFWNNLYKVFVDKATEKKSYYLKTLDECLNNSLNIDELKSLGSYSKTLQENVSNQYISLENKLKNRNRYNIIMKLLENGFVVHYIGKCKNKEFAKYNNFVNHGPKKYEDMLTYMAKSKIVIDESSYCKNGSNARIYSAMLNKSLVFANKNNYSNDMYKDKESIVYYDINNLEEMIECIKYYLKNPYEMREIIKKAYFITRKYNTWNSRIIELLNIYDMMKEIIE